MNELVTFEEIQAAAERIRGVAARTTLHRLSRARLRMAGFVEAAEGFSDLYIKAESEQPIGSFKLRGAYNKIAQLADEALRRGVITYSSGNHAQGVAYAARARGARAVIVMPDNAPAIKVEATRALGAEIVFVGPASSDRRKQADQLAEKHGYTMIPPYDDREIVAGQGTCGLEILEQLPAVELVLAPVSGGGLLSGVAAALKLGIAQRTVPVWGVEPELAADAKQSFDTRQLVEWPAAKTVRTLADGLRTQSLGELNFEHVMKFVDGIVTVTEEEILTAMRVMLGATRLIPEPSGAVALAGALFHSAELPRARSVAVVMSGGNLEPELRERLELPLH